jgi:hypothetical protein
MPAAAARICDVGAIKRLAEAFDSAFTFEEKEERNE